MSRAAALAAALAAACASPPPPRADAECAGCHATHAEDFQASAHARASESDLFRALRGRADPATRAFCDRCHAPHEGSSVGCVTCHAAVATRGVSNGRLVHGDGATMYGPLDDARPTSAHASRRSDFVRSADLCGTCHEVAGPGAFVETPYAEWSRSTARAAGVTCADCHMSPSPGDPGAPRATAPVATGGAPRRRSEHAFVGPEHPRAAELFRASAALDLAVHARDGDALDVEVGVTNRNPGHALPSGARFAREVWVELTATDARGAAHVVSGGLDARGAPLTGDLQRVELHDRLARHGAFALPQDADPSEVRAVPAGARRSWRYRVPASWEGAATTSVSARLRYRRNAWALREALGLPPDASPILDLARGELSVRP